jgi:hypothetical protein
MCGTEGYSGVYGRLKRLLVAGQRTILVPQAGYNSSPGCCNTAIQEELDRLYQLSLSDPTVVAVVPFIWETVPGNWASGLDNYVGTAMETSYTTIGAQVKSGFTYPAGVQPVIQSDPTQNSLLLREHRVEHRQLEILKSRHSTTGIRFVQKPKHFFETFVPTTT